MKTFLASLLLSVCFLVVAPSRAFAASLAGDFSITNGNPNGAWTYGYSVNLNAGYALTTYTASTAALGGVSGENGWLGNLHSSVTPVVLYNASASTIIFATDQIPSHTAVLAPGTGGELSIARYTVPSNGLYSISALFSGDDIVSTDVHVLLNGGSLFNSPLVGFGSTAPYSNTLTLTAGSTLDFAVGFGGNNNANDSVGVAAFITAVPEPASLAMCGMILPALLLRRRSKRS